MLNLLPSRIARIGGAALLLLWTVPGTAPAANTDIVINELMYHPPHDLDELQYVELYNRGANTVDLSHWEFTKGIRFTFPHPTVLAPEAYLVLCRNRQAFTNYYGTNLVVAGDFAGRLSHNGEKIVLCDAQRNILEVVEYADRSPWPTGPDGGSASLERVCPEGPGDVPSNWAGSELPDIKQPAGTPGRRNDSWSANPPPVIAHVAFSPPTANRETVVTAEVGDPDGIQSVALRFRLVSPGNEEPESSRSMQRISGDARLGTYRASIPAQPPDRLVRFRIHAADRTGAERYQPAPNEPRPTYSWTTFANTNTARIAFAYAINIQPPRRESRIRLGRTNGITVLAEPARGNGAFIYLPPHSREVALFDHVHIRYRSGGFKVHFQKDRPFEKMTGINVIFESSPRWVLAEPLAYELFRLAQVPAPAAEHVRCWFDGRLLGYYLLVEQPNKAFLARHHRNNNGNLYKLNWRGRGLVGQHEKKSNPATGHGDLLELVQQLNNLGGRNQWQFIQKHFNVAECVSYFAVNMCLQNWDGFFNNYYTYHDLEDTGRWEIYPWDEDKTWGDYDGASAQYDWYEMPLTYGMRGDPQPQANNPFAWLGWGRGLHGGPTWWRRGGWFSAPLLANPEFRKRFLARLDELCATVFTEEQFIPVIDALEKRLAPEIIVRARAAGSDVDLARKMFRQDIQSFRNQVKFRRKFLLSELAKLQPAPSGDQKPSQ